MAIMTPSTPYSLQLLAGQMLLPSQSSIVGAASAIKTDSTSPDTYASEGSSFSLTGQSPSPLAGAFKGHGYLSLLFHRREGGLEEDALSILSQKAKDRKDAPKGMLAQLHLEDAGGVSIHDIPAEQPSLRCASSRTVNRHIATLEDDDPDRREKAANALGKLRDARAIEPLIQAFADDDDDVRACVQKAIAHFGTSAVQPLITALRHRSVDIRWYAIVTLGELGDLRAVAPLITGLADENEEVRLVTAEALGELGDARAVAPLITALADENEEVRLAAVEALEKLGDGRAAQPLIQKFSDDDDEVRELARKTVLQFGNSAVEPLITALGDANADVRWYAAECLSKLGDGRAVGLLIKLLSDEDWGVRSQAAETLGNLGDLNAVDSLITALGDEHEEVRDSVSKALGKLGDARAIPPLIQAFATDDEEVQKSVRKAIAGFGNEAAEALITALSDANADVRWFAAEAVDTLGDVRAIDPLITLLMDEDWELRERAAETLGDIGDARAITPLTTALDDDREEVQLTAAEALEKLTARLQ